MMTEDANHDGQSNLATCPSPHTLDPSPIGLQDGQSNQTADPSSPTLDLSSLGLQDASTTKRTSHSTFSLESPSDDTTPCVYGLHAVSAETLLVADWDNSSLKLVDIPTRKITSQLATPDSPWDVTGLPADQVAVTLPYERTILVVSHKAGQLSVVRHFSVDGGCRGIVYMDNNTLVVTYIEYGKVEVLDLSGKVLHSIGREHFNRPLYATTQQTDGQTYIYVSDAATHTITKLTTDCAVLYTYTQDRLHPQGIVALGREHLAVCSRNRDTLLLLKDSGMDLREMKQWPCVSESLAIAVCPLTDSHIVYVSSYSDDLTHIIHQYKLEKSAVSKLSEKPPK